MAQLFIILFVALAVAGCGPKGLPTNYVEGIVTLDGQPLEGALVTFRPETPDGKVAVGQTDATGKYTLTTDGGLPQKGALEGEYKVTVTKIETTEVPRPTSLAIAANNPDYPVEMDTIQTLITPKNYSEVVTTPLTATVTKGKNDIPLEMKK